MTHPTRYDPSESDAQRRVATALLRASHPEADPETIDRAASLLEQFTAETRDEQDGEVTWHRALGYADALNAIFREDGTAAARHATPTVPSSST